MNWLVELQPGRVMQWLRRPNSARPGWLGRRERRRRAEAETEVFGVLQIQLRLGALTADLRRIEGDHHMYARHHHWHATMQAYDSLLAKACLLAGLDIPAKRDGEIAEEIRLRRELELSSHGWTW